MLSDSSKRHGGGHTPRSAKRDGVLVVKNMDKVAAGLMGIENSAITTLPFFFPRRSPLLVPLPSILSSIHHLKVALERNAFQPDFMLSSY
jgi:hypothetical protein